MKYDYVIIEWGGGGRQGCTLVVKTPTGSKNSDPVDHFPTIFLLTPIPLITSDLFFANSDPVDPVDHQESFGRGFFD